MAVIDPELSMRNSSLPILLFIVLLLLNSCKQEVELSPTMERVIELEASKGTYWNSILLTWKPVPQASMYEVYRLDAGTEEFVLIATSTQTQYVDEFEVLEQPLADIYYKVRAFNSSTEFGAFSDMAYGYYTARSYDVILEFGQFGQSAGGFDFSEHVTLDNAGNFYISETSVSNSSIQKFSADGVFVEQYYNCGSPRAFKFLPNNEALIACSSENTIKVIDAAKNPIREWGSTGSGDGQFRYFRQIAVDGETLFIVDHVNHRIQKMDIYGNFISKWGSEGLADGQFDNPWGIALFQNMVVVSSDKRLQFFDKNGTFIRSWYFDNVMGLHDLAADDEFIYVAAVNAVLKIDEDRHFTDRIGVGDGGAIGLALKENGDVVVVDTYERKVRVYRSNE